MNNFKTILITAMIVVCVTSCEKTEQEELTAKNETVNTVNDKELKDPIAFAMVDKAPVFPGCEGNQKQLKECMSSKITSIVNKNFDFKVTENLKGSVKIISSFVIDKNGSIKDIDIKATNEELKSEAKRLILLFPQMKPGEQNGKKVEVSYVLPIKFQVKE